MRLLSNPIKRPLGANPNNPTTRLVSIPGCERINGRESMLPFGCWVSFSIPVRAEGCAFWLLGIVFDTQGLCVSLVVPGIVFDTREGEGCAFLGGWVSFSIPLRVRAVPFGGWVSFSILTRTGWLSLWRNCHSLLSGIVFDTHEPCTSLVVLGIVFDTHECGGGISLLCPLGMIFNTREGGGLRDSLR